MKYFVIAALLSQASAADGCKGLKGQYYEKSGCEGDPKHTFNFAEGQDTKGKTLENTSGKCVPHNPASALVTTEATTKADMEETAKDAKDAAESRDAQDTLMVCSEMKKDGEFCTQGKQDVAKFFGTKYVELKKKYAAFKDAEKAYTDLEESLKTEVAKKGKLIAYKANLDAYNTAVFLALKDNEGAALPDPIQAAVLDAQAAGLAQEESAIGLTDDQLKVLDALNSKHTDVYTYFYQNFLTNSHLGHGVDAPNGACKPENLRTNQCLAVLKSDHKKCAGNTVSNSATPPTIANPSQCDGPDDPNYTYLQMMKIVGDYLDKDYIYDGLQAEATTAAEAHKGAEKKLVAETFSIKLVCDKKKWTFTEYDDLECKDKPKEFTAKWGDCVKGPDGGYIKMTGAIALKAAAAALVAFAGSQF